MKRILIALGLTLACLGQAQMPPIQTLWTRGNTADAGAMALTGDGATLWTVGSKSLKKFRTSNMELLGSWPITLDRYALAVNRAGTRLATVALDNPVTPTKATLQIRNTQTLAVMKSVDFAVTSPGCKIKMSYNGSYLGVTYANPTNGAMVVDARTFEVRYHNDHARGVAFSRDGSRFATSESSIVINRCTDGSRAFTWVKNVHVPLEFSPNGKTLAYWKGSVCYAPIGDDNSEVEVGNIGNYFVDSLVFEDSRILFSTVIFEMKGFDYTPTVSRSLFTYEIPTQTLINGRKMNDALELYYPPIAYDSPNNQVYVGEHTPYNLNPGDYTFDNQKAARGWITRISLSDWSLERFHGPGAAVSDLRWSDDDTKLVSASLDSSAEVWRPTQVSFISDYPPLTQADTMSISPDLRYCASNGRYVDYRQNNYRFYLRDLSTGSSKVFRFFRDKVECFGWSPDSSFLLFKDGEELTRYSVGTKKTLWKIPYDSSTTGSVSSITVSPDGSEVRCAGDFRYIRVLNAATGAFVRDIPRTTAGTMTSSIGVRRLSVWPLTPKSATNANPIEIRNSVTLELIRTLFAPAGTLRKATLTLDGRRLVLGYADKLVFMDAVTGAVLGRYTAEAGGGVSAIALAPDGVRLAIGREEGALAVIRDPFWADFTNITTVQLQSGMVGGVPGLGSVSLAEPALVDTTIRLESDDTASVRVPDKVVVPKGEVIATFEFTTLPVDATHDVRVTATYRTVSASATMSVRAAGVAAMSVSPVRVQSGQPVEGKITLEGRYATVDADVVVTVNDGVPFGGQTEFHILVPAGLLSVPFSLPTVVTSANHTVTLTATLAGKSASKSVLITK